MSGAGRELGLEAEASQLLQRMREEERKEAAEYERIFAQARDPACAREELYGQGSLEDEGEEREGAFLSSRLSAMDREGNPTWIDIAPLERSGRYEGLVSDEGGFAGSREKTGRLSRRFGTKETKEHGPGNSPPPKGKGLLGRFGGGGQAANAKQSRAARELQGRGSLSAHKPRPLRGLARVLLVTAVLALLYHFFAGRGWLPRLWQ